MMNHKQLGALGEQIARKHLLNLGYREIVGNWRTRYGEIDLIMLSPDQLLVFVEVKLRTSNTKGSGFEAVDSRKLQKIHRLTERFLQLTPQYRNYPLRIDVISIEYDKHTESIKDVTHLTGV